MPTTSVRRRISWLRAPAGCCSRSGARAPSEPRSRREDVRGRESVGTSLLEIVHVPEPENARQLVERGHRLAREAGVGQIAAQKPIPVVPADPGLQLGAERLIPEDPRLPGPALCLLEHDPLPQAPRTA